MNDTASQYERMKICNIDWQNWSHQEDCTLLFIRQADQVLMIRKKRGLGAGKINGPGGHIEAGETPLECAIRETEEELCITPRGVKPAAELFFHAEDADAMPRIHAFVFIASDYAGQPTETAEAIPIWFNVADIPYNEMWEDDKFWLPQALAGKYLHGWFSFKAEALLDYRVECRPPPKT